MCSVEIMGFASFYHSIEENAFIGSIDVFNLKPLIKRLVGGAVRLKH